MELKALLQEMIDKKASDVFIVAGLPLTYTADGRQVRMDMAPLMPADTKELVGRHLRAVRPRRADLHGRPQP